ncbi:hypothetical protein [Chryseobacterium sp. CFBP8996]|uniref:hypothetical protein n=1 Tax=Chryseobacterium sp. CFBP8996 TaxID=3096529 RepID=UPI002A6A5108|nr:hypothetical protein [Chryseobacterium sp. CFBP8996]MDY0930126.1 hypothetical protein [Chryseobacterium sp. CFBP8996]
MDSENTAMKYKSSLPYNKGRFFILFLLFAGFHIMQASCGQEETYAENKQEIKIVISEGTTVIGLENLHIASTETKNAQGQPKKLKKISAVKKLDSQKSKKKTFKKKQHPKPVYSFSNNPKSDIRLHSSMSMARAFGGFKCIAANEMEIIRILLFITSIFLINFYKSRSFSGCCFLQNFQRPPPNFIS